MNIQQYKPHVNSFHFDVKEDFEEYETDIKVHLTPLSLSYSDDPNDNCTFGIRLDFTILLDKFVISSSLGQVSSFKDRNIRLKEELSKEELEELLQPLFELVERMVYDVSEIALDEPGISIHFDQIYNEFLENGKEG